MSKIVKSVTLYFTKGSSDKVYQISIVELGGGYMVEAQNGRRGSTMKTRSKTDSPVSYAEADAIYTELLAKKTGEGYTKDTSGSVYAGTENAGRYVGFKPQLLNPVDESEVELLIKSDDWMLQEKHDGERQFLIHHEGRIFGANRNGLEVAIPQARVDLMWEILGSDMGTVVFDGESIGDRFYIFDVLQVDGASVENNAAETRLKVIADMLNNTIGRGEIVDTIDTYYNEGDKRTAFERLRAENAEGVVFKRKRSQYTQDRPNTGGDQLKFKFYDELTVQAGDKNLGKRSVQICMRDGQNLVDVGNVTIPENTNIPVKGEFIEVRYLYANNGGSLFQPVYQKPRTDKHEADDISQIKIKRDHEAHVARGPRP